MSSKESFQALRSFQDESGIATRLTTLSVDELSAGDVTIRAAFSSVNYKDALAATGKGKILRQLPLNPGIDVAGTVIESQSVEFSAGDEVLVTGCGIGESFDGGYSEIVRLRSEDTIKLPAGLSLQDVMVFGTAGFTAALCIERMQTSGQRPAQGPILVTGASGGVGSLAVAFLKKAGFTVHAVSSKKDRWDWLRAIGADLLLHPSELAFGDRPLESVRFAGAIDNVGGELLEGVMRHTELWGNIACVGLAGGHQFSNTVMPMILRGVSLLGISSANCPMPLRRKVWNRLATDLKPR